MAARWCRYTGQLPNPKHRGPRVYGAWPTEGSSDVALSALLPAGDGVFGVDGEFTQVETLAGPKRKDPERHPHPLMSKHGEILVLDHVSPLAVPRGDQNVPLPSRGEATTAGQVQEEEGVGGSPAGADTAARAASVDVVEFAALHHRSRRDVPRRRQAVRRLSPINQQAQPAPLLLGQICFNKLARIARLTCLPQYICETGGPQDRKGGQGKRTRTSQAKSGLAIRRLRLSRAGSCEASQERTWAPDPHWRCAPRRRLHHPDLCATGGPRHPPPPQARSPSKATHPTPRHHGRSAGRPRTPATWFRQVTASNSRIPLVPDAPGTLALPCVCSGSGERQRSLSP